jgi:large subunit ribosomal protein L23
LTARDIILRPVITEKSMAGVREGRYTFAVAPDANKIQIRQAVEEIWGVRVTKVNTMWVRGKTRRMGRAVGRRPDWKKAVVTLAPGQRIEFFEGLT